MSFPRYPQYKDSGVEWLGEVPEHWAVKRLKYLGEAIIGLTYSPDDIVDEGVGTLVLRSSNVQGRSIVLNDNVYVSAHIPDELVTKVGDILICSRNGSRALIGKNARICERAAGLTFGAFMTLFRSPEHAYIFCILNSPIFEHQSGAFMTSTINQLTIGVLNNIEVPLPPPRERATIAEFLERETAKIDELVAEQERLMELLKEKRQAVISHAVTKGLNPNAPMKPSGIEWLGDVPAHWEVIALKRIADVQTGVAKGKDNGSRKTVSVPYLRVANVQDGYLDLESVATIDIPVEDLERYKLQAGDVLMNEGGDFDKLGRGHVWDGQIDPCITQNHVFAVRPRQVSALWLNAITSSSFAQFYFMTRSKQSTNLASISSTNLMELPVILPPVQEQNAILAFIADNTERFDKLTSEAQRAIDLLQERRTALISAAVTGQIDVRPQRHEPRQAAK